MGNIVNFRPMNFDSVIGNENQIKLIKNSLSEKKYPAFSILTGKAGIGKTTLAKIIAKSLLCDSPINGIACDRCPTCLSVNTNFILGDQDIHNVHTFRMSDEGGKIAARQILEMIKTKPLGKGKKVILLEECQGFELHAQDLLLPILEYIPEHTHIIAMTTNEAKLQNTFTSRAIMYRLIQPPQSLVEMLLQQTADKMGLDIKGSTVITRIVEYGQRPRDALNLLMKVAQSSDKITIADVNNYLNLVDDSLYLKYLNVVKRDMGAVLDFIEELKNTGTTFEDYMRGLNSFVIRLLTFKYRKGYIQDSIIDGCRQFISSTTESDLLYIQSTIAEDAPKFGAEEFDESLFIATSYRIQERNHSQLKEKAFTSQQDIHKEQERRKRALAERAQEELSKVSAEDLVTNGDIPSFLANISGAKIVE